MKNKKYKNIGKSLVSWIFALIASTFFVGLTLQVFGAFEIEMLPKLIIPIFIVSIVFYIFFKKSLFK